MFTVLPLFIHQGAQHRHPTLFLRCFHLQVKPFQLRVALDNMKAKKNPCFDALTEREQDVVCYLNVAFPLSTFKIGSEEVVDVFLAKNVTS